jgi:hypothetical protein
MLRDIVREYKELKNFCVDMLKIKIFLISSSSKKKKELLNPQKKHVYFLNKDFMNPYA